MRWSPPYSEYARVYDQIGQRGFGERMASVILEELSERGIVPRTVLDLGCGTGSATMAFARGGLRATGLDRSAEMLARARDLAMLEQLDVHFLEGDMTDLQLAASFDLVTCIYDTVNYLPGGTELRALFHAVFAALLPGGSFVFDMNTRHRLSNSWEQGLILASDSDDLFVTYRSWFDEGLDVSPLIVTGFVRQTDRSWIRFDEEHIERSWPIAAVQEWLRQAGFQIEQVTGYIDVTGELVRPAREEHGRVLF